MNYHDIKPNDSVIIIHQSTRHVHTVVSEVKDDGTVLMAVPHSGGPHPIYVKTMRESLQYVWHGEHPYEKFDIMRDSDHLKRTVNGTASTFIVMADNVQNHKDKQVDDMYRRLRIMYTGIEE